MTCQTTEAASIMMMVGVSVIMFIPALFDKLRGAMSLDEFDLRMGSRHLRGRYLGFWVDD